MVYYLIAMNWVNTPISSLSGTQRHEGLELPPESDMLLLSCDCNLRSEHQSADEDCVILPKYLSNTILLCVLDYTLRKQEVFKTLQSHE